MGAASGHSGYLSLNDKWYFFNNFNKNIKYLRAKK